MVIAHHLIWTAYGWWLPNDPRGSTSRAVASARIAPLGELHHGQRPVQPPSRVIREFYHRAAEALKHPLLRFSPDDFPAVAEALAEALERFQYTCYACAIMPDHVHLLIRKHRDRAETMIDNIQQTSRERLIADGLRGPAHPVWTTGGWKGFRNHPDAVRSTIGYIAHNPPEIGLPVQQWPFVVEYGGWPFRQFADDRGAG